MKSLKQLNKYFLKYKFYLIVGLVITVISNLFSLYAYRLIGSSFNVINSRINNTITNEVFKQELLLNSSLVIGAALVSGFFTFLMRQTIINVSRKIEFDIKNDIYAHYQKLSLSFYKRNRTGDLMNRITEDVSKVRMYVGPAVMYTINTLTLFTVILTYMFSTAPKLAAYTILPLPVLSFIIYKLSKSINLKSTLVQEQLSKLSTFTQETFSGISLIKSYSLEGKKYSDFDSLSTSTKEKKIDLAKIQSLFIPSMILLIGLSNLIVIYVGGLSYINGSIKEIGTIAEFILYVNKLTWPVATVGWVTSIVQQAAASQKRINEFLCEEPEVKNISNGLNNILGDIEFRNVSFIYPDTGIEALKNVSFKIKEGEKLLIVGKIGSGKTTILELLARLYDPTEGEILLNSKPLRNYNLNTLRESIGFVPQDSFLFSDTIGNNIKFGNRKANHEMVIASAKKSFVHHDIDNFETKYNAMLGERGINLSGGQKQRISIARALIKNPKLLLFDDCLSAVDTETEKEILDNITKDKERKTIIIVSHRVSSGSRTDQVIVLDKGEIIEKGNHVELVKKSGVYHTLIELQNNTK